MTANPTEPRPVHSTSDLTWVAQGAELVARNMERVIRGKPDAVALTVIAMLAEGHVLVEDVPGVGKTSLARALAASIDAGWPTGSSSPPTCCRPTSPARRSTTPARQRRSRSTRGRSSPTWCWPTRSTGRRRRPSRRCWRSWRSAGSPSTGWPTRCPGRSWSWPPRTPSRWTAPTACPRRSSTGSSIRLAMGYPDAAARPRSWPPTAPRTASPICARWPPPVTWPGW